MGKHGLLEETGQQLAIWKKEPKMLSLQIDI